MPGLKVPEINLLNFISINPKPTDHTEKTVWARELERTIIIFVMQYFYQYYAVFCIFIKIYLEER